MSTEEMIKAIESMTVVELHEMVEAIKERFGVTAMAVAAGPAAASAGPVAAEKTEFNVVLKESGANKIAVIKEVKAITGLGLKEAKDLVDKSGSLIKGPVKKEEAEEIKSKIEAAGGSVELQ